MHVQPPRRRFQVDLETQPAEPVTEVSDTLMDSPDETAEVPSTPKQSQANGEIDTRDKSWSPLRETKPSCKSKAAKQADPEPPAAPPLELSESN